MKPRVLDKPQAGLRAGLPRPVAPDPEGTLRPLPWTQNAAWGGLDDDRSNKCGDKSLCLVCGLEVKIGVVIIEHKAAPNGSAWGHDGPPKIVKFFYDINDLMHRREGLKIVERGAMHEKCAMIARAHCKPLRDGFVSEAYEERPYFRGRKKRQSV